VSTCLSSTCSSSTVDQTALTNLAQTLCGGMYLLTVFLFRVVFLIKLLVSNTTNTGTGTSTGTGTNTGTGTSTGSSTNTNTALVLVPPPALPPPVAPRQPPHMPVALAFLRSYRSFLPSSPLRVLRSLAPSPDKIPRNASLLSFGQSISFGAQKEGGWRPYGQYVLLYTLANPHSIVTDIKFEA
jgi:hypothetical protein